MTDCNHDNLDVVINDLNEKFYVCEDCNEILEESPEQDRAEWNAERLYDDD